MAVLGWNILILSRICACHQPSQKRLIHPAQNINNGDLPCIKHPFVVRHANHDKLWHLTTIHNANCCPNEAWWSSGATFCEMFFGKVSSLQCFKTACYYEHGIEEFISKLDTQESSTSTLSPSSSCVTVSVLTCPSFKPVKLFILPVIVLNCIFLIACVFYIYYQICEG